MSGEERAHVECQMPRAAAATVLAADNNRTLRQLTFSTTAARRALTICTSQVCVRELYAGSGRNCYAFYSVAILPNRSANLPDVEWDLNKN